MNSDFITDAQKVFDAEIEALRSTRDCLNHVFIDILNTITACSGRIIITGMGKSGHIARKIAATMASLGTPSFYLHPGEALHGDLGMVTASDIVIAISYSGESEEITRILANIRMIGAKIIAITAKENSTLAKHSDLVQILPPFKEACFMNLAPTSSTTATLVYGDALAVLASKQYGFNENNFGLFHPAGTLGKKLLLHTKDIMVTGERNAVLPYGISLKDVIIELSKKALGIVTLVDKDEKIAGVITDGDLRRSLEKHYNIYSLHATDIMTSSPISANQNILAIEALQLMKSKKVSCMPVTDDFGAVVGTISVQDILNSGII